MLFSAAGFPSALTSGFVDHRFEGGAPIDGAESLAVYVRPAVGARPPGSQVTVVLIPGPIGSAYSMRHITDALAESAIGTVVIDPLGMGTSARPEHADYTLARQATRIQAVLDTLPVTRVILVGQGTSATVALHLAATDPARVAAVLSLAGGPVDHQGTKGVRLALAFSALLDNPIGRAIGRRKFLAAVREQSVSDAWCTPDVLRAYLGPFERDLRGGLRVLQAMNEAVEPASIASRLHAVQAPVRLLVGEKRSANAPSDEQMLLMAQQLPHFRADTVARSGTMLTEERPDAVVAAIRDMMRGLSKP